MHLRIMDLPPRADSCWSCSDFFFQNKVQAHGHNQELSDSPKRFRQDDDVPVSI